MSREWLQKLAELSYDTASRDRTRPVPRAARRGLLGAAIGFFLRLAAVLAILEVIAMLAAAAIAGHDDAPLGYLFHAIVWYGLAEGLGEAGLYETLRPILEGAADAAPFLAPLAIALAATIYFLPSINAARLRNPIRLIVYLVNLAFGWSLIGWVVSLVLSLAAGSGRAAPDAIRGGSAAARASPAGTAPDARAPAQAVLRSNREPTVIRRGGSAPSWVRPR